MADGGDIWPLVERIQGELRVMKEYVLERECRRAAVALRGCGGEGTTMCAPLR